MNTFIGFLVFGFVLYSVTGISWHKDVMETADYSRLQLPVTPSLTVMETTVGLQLPATPSLTGMETSASLQIFTTPSLAVIETSAWLELSATPSLKVMETSASPQLSATPSSTVMETSASSQLSATPSLTDTATTVGTMPTAILSSRVTATSSIAQPSATPSVTDTTTTPTGIPPTTSPKDTATTATGIPPTTSPKAIWEKIGCFRDRYSPDRPYPIELLNRRDPNSKHWDGVAIDWRKWPESLLSLTSKCATLAKKAGYTYFGIQNYGECFSGPRMDYFRDGMSKKCMGVDFKPCKDSDRTPCAGENYVNYIYRVEASVGEDIVFLLDRSQDFLGDAATFKRTKQFISQFLQNYESEGFTRFALYTFDSLVETSVSLKDYTDRDQLLRQVDGLRVGSGEKHTFAGLTALQNTFRRESTPTYKKVAVVITNGFTPPTRFGDGFTLVSTEAKKLRNQGVHVISVGLVTEPSVPELRAIASHPKAENAIISTDYQEAADIATKLTDQYVKGI